jgi:peptide/nickel transport system permease protein
MMRVVASRLAWTLVILLGVSFTAFMLMRALPGDFAVAGRGHAGGFAGGARHHPARPRPRPPLLEQYLLWLGKALTGISAHPS